MERGWKNVLLFCRSHKTVSKCYSTVLNALKEKAHIDIGETGRRDYKTRIIAMFHSDTDQDVKDHVIKSFFFRVMVQFVLFLQQLHLAWGWIAAKA